MYCSQLLHNCFDCRFSLKSKWIIVQYTTIWDPGSKNDINLCLFCEYGIKEFLSKKRHNIFESKNETNSQCWRSFFPREVSFQEKRRFTIFFRFCTENLFMSFLLSKCFVPIFLQFFFYRFRKQIIWKKNFAVRVSYDNNEIHTCFNVNINK